MSGTSDRIPCPHCGANNFASSSVCWQCGQPLRAQQNETPGTPPPGTPPPPGPIEPPPPGGPSYYQPGPPPPSNTNILITLGWIFAVLGLIPCCGAIFGVASIVLGIIAVSKGDKRGVWVIVAAVAAIIIGTALYIAWIAKSLPEVMRQIEQQQNMPTPPPSLPGK